MNKRGSVPADLIVMMVILLIVAISSLFAFTMYGDMRDEILDTYEGTDPVVNETLTAGENVLDILDYFWLGLFVALLIGLAVTSMMVDVHPVFLGIMFIIGAAVITIAAQFSNVYTEVGDQTYLANATTSFPMTEYVMGAFPLFMLVIVILVVIILLAKPRFIGGSSPG